MKSSMIFGAGAIGLAFLGDLLDRSGYRIVFVDVREEIVNWLRLRGKYSIYLADVDGVTEREIDSVTAINSAQYDSAPSVKDGLCREIAKAEVIFTASGEAALTPVGRVIGESMAYRIKKNEEPLNIICCENIQDPASILRAAIAEGAGESAGMLEGRVGICRSVISRMTPVVADPSHIVTEPYARIPVDGKPWLGDPPKIEGVFLVDDFEAYKMQKLIMHNMTHAVAAYAGYFLGKKDINEAVEDEDAGRVCRGALEESRKIMRAEYGLPDDELEEHALDLFRRYRNPRLGHTVANVGRDPMRKLKERDRFYWALALADKHKIPAPCAEMGAALAMRYDHPEDVSSGEMRELIEAEGADKFILEHLGLDPSSGAGRNVLTRYGEVCDAVDKSRASGDDRTIRDLIARTNS